MITLLIIMLLVVVLAVAILCIVGLGLPIILAVGFIALDITVAFLVIKFFFGDEMKKK